jgi:hypothetical protein
MYAVTRIVKFETRNRVMAARGKRRGQFELSINGYRASIRNDKKTKVPEMDDDSSYSTM